ncbi:MAG: hypothetical protein PF517_07135 [Salinivirgaceae bacterium]|jgi:predicted neutral ceramidase superfamily lipid hydrolase|nr:hypothetical protein [Salinivirgaceae bacterium]
MQKNHLENTTQNSRINIIWCFLNRHINFKIGILSGFAAGSIVFAINISHGFLPAIASLAKQFGFNLIMAGFNTRSCEKIVKKIDHNLLSLFLASVIPTLQAFLILYCIHYFGKTPKPMASTIWQVPLNLGIFLFFALVFRQVITIKSPSFKKILSAFRLRFFSQQKRLNGIGKSRKQAS